MDGTGDDKTSPRPVSIADSPRGREISSLFAENIIEAIGFFDWTCPPLSAYIGGHALEQN